MEQNLDARVDAALAQVRASSGWLWRLVNFLSLGQVGRLMTASYLVGYRDGLVWMRRNLSDDQLRSPSPNGR